MKRKFDLCYGAMNGLFVVDYLLLEYLSVCTGVMSDEPFETWCGTVWPRLVRVVGPWCERPGDAEDIAQEALVRSVARFDRDSEVPTLTWVTTVAMNLARSRLRRLRVERRYAAESRSSADSGTADSMTDAVVAAMRTLPDRQRRAVALRYLGDLSVDETAEVMGCAPATVKAHVRDAFVALRSHPALRDPERAPSDLEEVE